MGFGARHGLQLLRHGAGSLLVKVSYFQKPYRRIIIENFGARVFASPSSNTHYGSDILAEDPDSPGSLGMAISEAVEAAASSGGTKKYSLGSVLNLVLMHQTVIGIESLQQMEMAGEYPGLASARDETVATSPDCPAAICPQTRMLPVSATVSSSVSGPSSLLYSLSCLFIAFVTTVTTVTGFPR